MSSLDPVNSPFDGASKKSAVAVRHGEAALQASQATAEQVVRVMAQMALMNPRDHQERRQELLEACRRPAFADNTQYSFPRKGKDGKRVTIRGPNVALAREAARCWRNVQYGFYVVSSDEVETQLRGFAWDLEANIRVELEDRFRRLHQRTDRETGEVRWEEPDERDVRELVNRKGAILVRNCILQLLPKDLIEEALAQAEKTCVAYQQGRLEKDRPQVVKQLVDAFHSFGVTPAMLEAYLGHELKVIDAKEVDALRAIWNGIRDGQTTREEHFDLQAGEKKRGPKAKKGAKKELDDLIPKEKTEPEETASESTPEEDEASAQEVDEEDPFASWATDYPDQDPG